MYDVYFYNKEEIIIYFLKIKKKLKNKWMDSKLLTLVIVKNLLNKQRRRNHRYPTKPH
jgi:hypothetical protein